MKFNSNSENVYLVQCKQCLIQYLGETGTRVWKHIKLHKSHIHTLVPGPISNHLNSIDHNWVSDLGFVRLQGGFRTTRGSKNKKSELNYQLKTLEREGFNTLKATSPCHFSFIFNIDLTNAALLFCFLLDHLIQQEQTFYQLVNILWHQVLLASCQPHTAKLVLTEITTFLF